MLLDFGLPCDLPGGRVGGGALEAGVDLWTDLWVVCCDINTGIVETLVSALLAQVMINEAVNIRELDFLCFVLARRFL